MQLSLNALLLWKGVRPDLAFSTSSQSEISFYLWTSDAPNLINDTSAVAEYFDAAAVGDVFIALIQRSQNIPEWQQFIRQVFLLDNFGAEQDSLGTVVFVAVADTSDSAAVRWIAWCFGTGFRSLRRRAVEPRFGLLVALNAIAASAGGAQGIGPGAMLREVRYRASAPYFQQAGHRASREIPIEGFRVDPRSDLVSEAGGASGGVLGDVVGGRSVRFTDDVSDIPTLVALSYAVYAKAAEDTYKNWIDNITPVDDVNAVDELRQSLAQMILATPTPASVDVIWPDNLSEVSDERPIRYVLYPSEQAAKDGSVTFQIGRIKDLVASFGVDAFDKKLRFLDDARELIGSVPVIECLTADIIMNGSQYIAHEGDFYRVSAPFIELVNAEVATIPSSNLSLPCHNGEVEGDYNKQVAQADADYILLDKALIRIPGEFGVEAADLLHSSGALVHVKRGGQSDTLSHLFFQVQNSCELLRRSEEFRNAFRRVVHKVAQSAGRDPTKWTFSSPERPAGPEAVFAFVGVWKGRTAVNLPLFSRVGLVQTTQRLRSLGFDATVKFVDACPISH